MKTHFFIFIILISFFNQCENKSSKPLELVKKIFEGEIKEYDSIFIGLAKTQDFTPQFSKNLKHTYYILLEEKDKAVISVSFYDDERETDYYVYLIKPQDTWKVTEFCTLWFHDNFLKILQRIEGLSIDEIRNRYDELFLEEKDRLKHFAQILMTKEEYVNSVLNIQLIASPDRKLISHFNMNKKNLNQLLSKILSDTIKKDKNSTWEISKYDEKKLKAERDEVLISSISGDANMDFIDFRIGGMFDNFVGYLYCTNPDKLPEMGVSLKRMVSDYKYIMIRKLGENWYLYKTTHIN